MNHGNCPSYPTCSRYAIISLHKYGAFWGLMMSIDRIMYRENMSMLRHYNIIDINGKYYFYDISENNYIFHKIRSIKP